MREWCPLSTCEVVFSLWWGSIWLLSLSIDHIYFCYTIPKPKCIDLSAFCHWADQSPMSSTASDLHRSFQTFGTYLIKFISVKYLVIIIACKYFRDNASSILLLLLKCYLCIYALSGLSPTSNAVSSKGIWSGCEKQDLLKFFRILVALLPFFHDFWCRKESSGYFVLDLRLMICNGCIFSSSFEFWWVFQLIFG